MVAGGESQGRGHDPSLLGGRQRLLVFRGQPEDGNVPPMRNPLAPLWRVDRHLLLRRAGAATAFTFLAVFATGWPLRLPETPLGIVSLELARSAARASDVVASWDSAGLSAVATANVILDFSFLASYAVLLAVLALWSGARLAVGRSEGWLVAGAVVGWIQIGAGALDAGENIGLLLMLGGSISDGLAALVRVVALVKFGLVAFGLVWAAIGLAVGLGRKAP